MQYINIFYLLIQTILVEGHACRIDRGNAFKNTILVIGDDIAYGKGDPTRIYNVPGVAGKLAKFLSKEPIKQSWNIYNCGVVGSTSSDWLPLSKTTANFSLFDRVFSIKKYNDAQIILLFIGYNDVRKGIDVEQCIQNIKDIVRVLVDMGKEVYLCPVMNQFDHLEGDLYGENIKLNDFIIQFCADVSQLLYSNKTKYTPWTCLLYSEF